MGKIHLNALDKNVSRELEYKYKADAINLSDFKNLMSSLTVEQTLEISSPDVYFKSLTSEDKFLRYRISSDPELTIKIKHKASNNWDRIEVDLPLDVFRITEQIINDFATLIGFERNFQIFKVCFIYKLEQVNYVFYLVFDENMELLGKFIEVEVNKETIIDIDSAEATLNEAAAILEPLGLKPQNRLKKSLFEMFRK